MNVLNLFFRIDGRVRELSLCLFDVNVFSVAHLKIIGTSIFTAPAPSDPKGNGKLKILLVKKFSLFTQ